jgi:hypothetical protein
VRATPLLILLVLLGFLVGAVGIEPTTSPV